MKRLLCNVIFFFSVLTTFGKSITVNKITYSTNETAQTATVTAFDFGLKDVVIPSEVTYNGVNYRVTAIADKGLYGFKTGPKYASMQTLVISEGIEKIGKNAVERNNILKSVSLPSTLVTIDESAFNDVSSLESVVFPNGSSLKTIAKNAFNDCSGLTEITIGNNITSIGDYAFNGCSKLETLNFGSNVTPSPKLSPTFPESLESIGNYAFKEVPAFKNLILQGTLTKISQGSFYNCPNIEYIWIQEGISTIQSQAFFNCRALTYIVLPSTLSKVESGVFACSYENNTVTRTVNRTYVLLADTPFKYIKYEETWVDFSSHYFKMITYPNIQQIVGDKIYVKESAIEQYKEAWKQGISSTYFDYKIPFNSELTYSSNYREFDADYSSASNSGNKPFVAVGYSDDYVSFKSIDSNIVPAETGVVIYKTSDTNNWYQIAENQGNSFEETNFLKGVGYSDIISPISSDGNINYVLYNGEFCRFNNEGLLGDHKVYLQLPSSSSSHIKINLSDNNTTNITNNLIETQQDRRIYNLNGMIVEHPQNGIYIINGKKVFIK